MYLPKMPRQAVGMQVLLGMRSLLCEFEDGVENIQPDTCVNHNSDRLDVSFDVMVVRWGYRQ